MKRISALIIFASLSITINFTFAETWPLMQKILAPDYATDDNFGYSAAISGDYAIMGSHFDNVPASNAGSAYIFMRDGIIWTSQSKLVASDGAADDEFGCSVSISGYFAIAGARQNDSMYANSGAAYIFVRGGTTWTQQVKLVASDAALGDYFGHSVSIDGDYVIAGAPLDDSSGTDSGSAYIFARGFTGWTQQAKLVASDGAEDDYFGCSVSISGDYAIVGAYTDDDRGTNTGSAYIFTRDGTAWAQQSKLLAPDGNIEDWLGWSVAISGDYAIAGACFNDENGDDSGAVYLYGFTPEADLNDDFKVDLADFAIFAQWWLHETGQ